MLETSWSKAHLLASQRPHPIRQIFQRLAFVPAYDRWGTSQDLAPATYGRALLTRFRENRTCYIVEGTQLSLERKSVPGDDWQQLNPGTLTRVGVPERRDSAP